MKIAVEQPLRREEFKQLRDVGYGLWKPVHDRLSHVFFFKNSEYGDVSMIEVNSKFIFYVGPGHQYMKEEVIPFKGKITFEQ
jgi:hypothetical protein